MKTLIELYDERPIENVLAADVFKPERVVYLCPGEVAGNKSLQNKIREFFFHRGINTEIIFRESSLFYASKVKVQLEKIEQEYPECAVDITGGTDAALFAAGAFCSQSKLPAFTYSRKKNRFFNINSAEFAENVRFESSYTAEDFFMMAGGAMKHGRVDNEEIDRHYSVINNFFSVYLSNRRDWVKFVSWMQRASSTEKCGNSILHVNAEYFQRGERGAKIRANEKILNSLEHIGMIHHLRITANEKVSFSFADSQTRKWLRDVGAVLEIYIYKACKDSEIFSDVNCSTVVEWEGINPEDKVENEIDVVAVKNVIPVFISCKTCNIETYALNELAILRDRFGGESAKAIIVTAEKCKTITHQRANALDIDVIDITDLQSENISKKIASLV